MKGRTYAGRRERRVRSPILLTLVVALLLAGVALSSTGASAQGRSGASSDPTRPERTPTVDAGQAEEFFDDLIPEQLREGHVAGATVSVVQNGRPVFAKGYGYADLEQREPVVADETLFYPGSAGKLFTWTAVMQLVEEGKLDLDADVNRYLDFDVPDTHAEPITTSDLMTHTAGFEEEFSALFVAERQDVLPMREFLIRNMPERVYPPGEYFAYSNYGTALAGYIVERVSGMPYEQYVEENVLGPLGMENSSAGQPLPDRLAADLSKGYRYDGTYDPSDFEWLAAAPAAPVRATATDMSRFMLAHLQNGSYDGGRILEESTALDMHRQHFTHDPRLPGMAYGFIVSDENDRNIIRHDGASARFSTILALLPEERAGLFVSYNTPFEADDTLSAFLDRFYPSLEKKSPTEPPAGFAGRADRWAGTYVSTRVARSGPQKIVGWLDPFRVSAADEHLLVQTPFGEQRYVESEPGLLEQEDGERLLTFREDGQGRVTHAFWGTLAYSKVAPYQTPGFQLPLILACAALFLSTLVAFPIAFFARRWRKASTAPSGAARVARPLAGALAALNLLLMAWFLLALLGFAETYVWPTATVSAITRLWLIGIPPTLGVVVLAAWAWKGRFWNAVARVHYTLVALGGVLFVLLLFNWNLVGL